MFNALALYIIERFTIAKYNTANAYLRVVNIFLTAFFLAEILNVLLYRDELIRIFRSIKILRILKMCPNLCYSLV